jgi:Fe-S-cluster containining protein
MICRDPKCCQDFDINPLHLIRPDLMDERGREFMEAIGISHLPLYVLRLGAEVMPDGQVKIKHRCLQLLPNGACGIYETRPAICRDFDCSTRTDCECRK